MKAAAVAAADTAKSADADRAATRRTRMLRSDGSTRLRPDDELLLLTDPEGPDDWSRLFTNHPKRA